MSYSDIITCYTFFLLFLGGLTMRGPSTSYDVNRPKGTYITCTASFFIFLFYVCPLLVSFLFFSPLFLTFSSIPSLTYSFLFSIPAIIFSCRFRQVNVSVFPFPIFTGQDWSGFRLWRHLWMHAIVKPVRTKWIYDVYVLHVTIHDVLLLWSLEGYRRLKVSSNLPPPSFLFSAPFTFPFTSLPLLSLLFSTFHTPPTSLTFPHYSFFSSLSSVLPLSIPFFFSFFICTQFLRFLSLLIFFIYFPGLSLSHFAALGLRLVQHLNYPPLLSLTLWRDYRISSTSLPGNETPAHVYSLFHLWYYDFLQYSLYQC